MKVCYKSFMALIILLCMPTIAKAGATDNIRAFFKSNGGAINITEAGGHSGQRSGHYTLGGFTSRSNMVTVHPFSAQGPGLRGGCLGTDANFGSFSHIKSAELKRLLQGIISSGANYAFMIGFETLCPMCKKAMDQLNKLAQDINQWGMNNCNMAAAAMGSVLPQTEATSKYLCPHLATETGVASDYAAARQQCGAQGRANEVYARAKASGGDSAQVVKDFLVDKGNLAWRILKRRNYFKADSGEDDTLKELMMSLSGSIILQETNEARKFNILPSLASDKSIYNALLIGGDGNAATIYQCDTRDEDGCINPTQAQRFVVPEEQSFAGHVKRILISIQDKVLRDEGELTKAEIDLINATRKIPIEKAITVQATHSFVAEIINLPDYAEIVAADLLEDYLNEMLDAVDHGSRQIQMDRENMAQFRKNIQDAKYRIRLRNKKDEETFNKAFDFVQKLQLIEKMTAGEFSADLMQVVEWSANGGR